MVPAVFGRLHPRFHTPYVGIIAIGLLACVAPCSAERCWSGWWTPAASPRSWPTSSFPSLFWHCAARAGHDPGRSRVSHPSLVGIGAVVLAVALITAYLPGSPSALIWPYEWVTITTWSVLGVILYLRFRAGDQNRLS